MSLKYLVMVVGTAAAYPQITIQENGSPKTLYITGGDESKGGDRVEV